MKKNCDNVKVYNLKPVNLTNLTATMTVTGLFPMLCHLSIGKMNGWLCYPTKQPNTYLYIVTNVTVTEFVSYAVPL